MADPGLPCGDDREVICDICENDLTDDPLSGGYVSPPFSIGPCCATPEGMRQAADRNPLDVCPPRVSFADWIRARRQGARHGV